MYNLIDNLSHMGMALIVIIAVLILAVKKVISGTDALTVIIGVGGFSLGAGASSTSVSTVSRAASSLPNTSATAQMKDTSTVHIVPKAEG